MEVILREHIDNLGQRGEVVKVADGYARNYLLPRKLALLATEGNKKQIERERVSQQCGLTAETAEYEDLAGAKKLALSKQVQQLQFDMGVAQRTLDTVVQGASAIAGCELDGCISAAIGAGVIVAALTASNVTVSLQEKAINDK